jgi:Holliday junction resolvase RusA-like endonuclease
VAARAGEEVIFIITVPGAMKGKARPRAAMIAGRARMFTPSPTVSAEAFIKLCCVQQIGQPMLEGPLFVSVDIGVEIPASWSKRRRNDALEGLIRPTGKPDIDNCAKLIFDALNKLAWRDDSQIVRAAMSKIYVEIPQTVITISEAIE